MYYLLSLCMAYTNRNCITVSSVTSNFNSGEVTIGQFVVNGGKFEVCAAEDYLILQCLILM